MSAGSASDKRYSFDEKETRQIFNFFWLERGEKIDAMAITDERRHLAQKILIVAIDSTYAMGYVEILMRTAFSGQPFKGLAAMGRKLASSYLPLLNSEWVILGHVEHRDEELG